MRIILQIGLLIHTKETLIITEDLKIINDRDQAVAWFLQKENIQQINHWYIIGNLKQESILN